MKKLSLLFMFAVIAGFINCNGCQSKPKTQPSSSTPALKKTAPEPKKTTLSVGISQEFEFLNPITSSMLASTIINSALNRAMNSIDADWKWNCHLCKEMPSIEKGTAKIFEEDGKTKILSHWEIIENATWGDGVPVTGYDLRLAWQIGLSPNVIVGQKTTYETIDDIIVDPSNPKKFRIKQNKAEYTYAQMSRSTIPMVPSHIEANIWEKTKNSSGAYEKQTTYNSNPTNPGLYNGPFVLSEIKLGSHIAMKQNPYFYGKKPFFEKIIVKYIPNTQTLIANLLSGDIDKISQLGITLDQALALEKQMKEDNDLSRKVRIDLANSMVYEHIDLNLRNPLLKDKRVRKALVYSIDRDVLTKTLFEGKQEKAIHNIHPKDIYYTEDVVKYDYSPEKAEELLDAAGWKKSNDGYRYKDGKKLTFQIMTTSGNKARELVEVFLQHEWKKVGIEITVKNEPARVYFGETVHKAKYPAMAMYAWVSSPDNPPYSTLHKDEIPTKENGFSGQNSCGWSNDIVSDKLEAIRIEFDVEKRKELMQAVLWQYTDEVPVIPLYYRVDIAVVPKEMKGFRLTGHQFTSWESIEEWTL